MGLQHDRSEEVLRCQMRLVDAKLGNTADVLPERLPLLIFLPDVGALEQRDHEVLRQVEQLQRRPLEGLHGVILIVALSLRPAATLRGPSG